MPQPTGAAPHPVPAEDTVEVRPLRTTADYQECVRLQRETWGEQFADLVPPSILQVSQRIGGVAAGAFDADGRLLGFVFGMTGVEGGRLVHWSDMLAVRPEARDQGLGRRLKEYQRGAVAALGVEVICWTYDPLVARNARLNLVHLGAEVAEYVEDMYGPSDSDLHRGIGTDRLVVRWRVAATAPADPPSSAAVDATPVVNARDGVRFPEAAPPLLRIEIPADIHVVRQKSEQAAAGWRAATRAAFQGALARGYRVSGFHRDPTSGRCFYLLSLG